MPKKIIMFGLTFFGVSSSNFFNKGLPYKILLFLSSVLIPLSNDTTFYRQKRCGTYLNIYLFRLCRAQNDDKDQILNIRVFRKITFFIKIENLVF